MQHDKGDGEVVLRGRVSLLHHEAPYVWTVGWKIGMIIG